jgi:hypothetical protein
MREETLKELIELKMPIRIPFHYFSSLLNRYRENKHCGNDTNMLQLMLEAYKQNLLKEVEDTEKTLFSRALSSGYLELINWLVDLKKLGYDLNFGFYSFECWNIPIKALKLLKELKQRFYITERVIQNVCTYSSLEDLRFWCELYEEESKNNNYIFHVNAKAIESMYSNGKYEMIVTLKNFCDKHQLPFEINKADITYLATFGTSDKLFKHHWYPDASVYAQIFDFLYENYIELMTTEVVEKILKRSASYGAIEGFNYFYKRYKDKLPYTAKTIDEAADEGHVKVLQWFKDHQFEMKYDKAIDLASANGEIECLDFFKNECKEFRYTENSLDEIAEQNYIGNFYKANGHRIHDTLHWWIANPQFPMKYTVKFIDVLYSYLEDYDINAWKLTSKGVKEDYSDWKWNYEGLYPKKFDDYSYFYGDDEAADYVRDLKSGIECLRALYWLRKLNKEGKFELRYTSSEKLDVFFKCDPEKID